MKNGPVPSTKHTPSQTHNRVKPIIQELHAFEVEYIDQREAKPRALHRESIVLDGGRMNTLDHLNQTPQSWIRQQYAQQGYTVSAIHKGESLTAKVDTGFLWKLAALDAAAAKAGKSVAKLLEGGAAV